MQRRRNKAAAIKLMRKLLKKQIFAPDMRVTDKLRSCGATKSEIDCRRAMGRAFARTIGPRIRVNPHDNASVKCSGSNSPDQPNGTFPFTPPSKTRSTSSVIALPAARSASQEMKRSRRGEPLPRSEVRVLSKPRAAPIQVRVTTPSPLLSGAVTPKVTICFCRSVFGASKGGLCNRVWSRLPAQFGASLARKTAPAPRVQS